MKDMIYRQEAIEATWEEPSYTDPLNVLTEVRDRIEALPSAQPEPCEDAVSRQAVIEINQSYHGQMPNEVNHCIWKEINSLPSVTPKQRWIPVTLETLPNPNSVVVVCGKKGTWDYGTYRGWHGDIHSWWWKKKTIKHVYWWMYKDDAMSLPYREEGDE